LKPELLNRRDFMRLGVCGAGSLALGKTGWGALATSMNRGSRESSPEKPNIVIILADDLGYGDIGCYGATKVGTPYIDRIAEEGVLFTDAHTPSPICTPTRYSLLVGEYYWRIGPTIGRNWNRRRGLLIEEHRMTVPSLLKSVGYATGCVGKWHLGFGKDKPDWNGELKPGPLEVGFNYYFGTPNANNEAPFVYVENHRVVGLEATDPIEVDPVYARMKGGKRARRKNEEIALVQTAKAVSFIERHKAHPFFLYFAPCNVHVPLTPNARFKGTSKCGTYGDFIHELDWSVGEILSTLDRLNLADNTLLIFTSDNGAVHHRHAFAMGHRANGVLSGQKTDVWEGGHRVPFVVRWPGKVKSGTRSNELICVTDMLATIAALVGEELPREAGPDSFNILPALLDEPGHKPVRESVVMGWPGWAIREGPWLLIPHQGSGGVTTDPDNPAGKGWMTFAEIGHKNSDYTNDGKLKADAPPGQLYNLSRDLGETANLYNDYPGIVEHLRGLLEKFKRDRRSRP